MLSSLQLLCVFFRRVSHLKHVFIEAFNNSNKSKISLGKCHTTLENMWVIIKYLLILISNIIPQ